MLANEVRSKRVWSTLCCSSCDCVKPEVWALGQNLSKCSILLLILKIPALVICALQLSKHVRSLVSMRAPTFSTKPVTQSFALPLLFARSCIGTAAGYVRASWGDARCGCSPPRASSGCAPAGAPPSTASQHSSAPLTPSCWSATSRTTPAEGYPFLPARTLY